MGRTVFAGSLIRDQIDIYQSSQSVVRLTGVSIQQVSLVAFVDDVLLQWPLQDGTGVPDSAISSGGVFFNEIATSPGFYAIRFWPDRIGFWRLVFPLTTLGQERILSYDIVVPFNTGGNTLNASFLP